MKTVTFKLPFEDTVFTISGSDRDQSVLQMIQSSNGMYEPWILHQISRTLAADAVCLDIGANLGVIALAMAHFARAGLVHAFEPSKQNFDHLVNNIRLNHITNIQPHLLAIYDENTELAIDYVEEFAAGTFVATPAYVDSRAIRSSVHAVRLDDWANENAVSRVDLIKIDIEGLEWRALHGAQELIARHHPDLILELNPVAIRRYDHRTPEELLAKLDELYPLVYVLAHDYSLKRIKADADIAGLLINEHVVLDLYCTFRREPQPLTHSWLPQRLRAFRRR